VVLIDADPGMANRIAQRVESALRNDREQPALSVSIGIGIYPEDGRTAPELLQAADRSCTRARKQHTPTGQRRLIPVACENTATLGQWISFSGTTRSNCESVCSVH